MGGADGGAVSGGAGRAAGDGVGPAMKGAQDERAVDLRPFAECVGDRDPVVAVGGRTQWDVGGLPSPDAREVSPPSGIAWIAPDEMTVSCGAGTPVAELLAALR